MKASTSRANDVHQCFLKMNEIYVEYNMCKKENERHELLLKNHHSDKVVYVIKMKTFQDGSYILKIGETKNLKNRVKQLACEFKCKPTIMDIYETENPESFERFIHNHVYLKKLKYTNAVNDVKVSKECYLISNKEEYKFIISIMDENLYDFRTNKELIRLRIEEKKLDYEQRSSIEEKYNNTDKELLRLRIEMGKQELENKKLDLARDMMAMNAGEKVLTFMAIGQLSTLFNSSTQSSVNTAEADIREPTDGRDASTTSPDICAHCGQKKQAIKLPVEKKSQYQGPYVQMYDKDDFKKVLRVFENQMDLLREFKGMSQTQLKYSARYRLLYHNHRWHFVNRTDDPNKVYDIGQTAESHPNNTDLVCMLNKERTCIERIFCLQKEAGEYIGQHPSAISSSIKYGTLLSDKYWVSWSAVSQEIQEEYLENNSLPVRGNIVTKRGTKVEQLNPETREVIATYDSFSDAVKNVKTSAKSIKKAIANNMACSGFRWRLATDTPSTS